MPVTDRPATYREVFAEPVFRALFVARGVSISAISLQIFALSVLVYATTGSPLLSALAFGAGFLPQFAGGLLLGSLTDRLPSRPLITGGYLLEAALAATLGLADLPVLVNLLLVGAVAVFTPVFAGAAARVVAERLTGDAYVLGRSLTSMSSSAAQLLGLAAGGVAVAAIGARHALLLAAAAHLLTAVIVRFTLPDERPSTPHDGGAVRDSWTGAIGLLSDRGLRGLFLAQWLPTAFAVGAEALLVSYGARRGFPPGSGALLMAASPVGMLLGNLVVGRLLRPSVRERLAAPLVVLLGAPLLALPAALPLPAVVTVLAVAGAGFAYSLGLQREFLEAAPPARRGQVFALLSTGMMALQGVGPLAFGALAEWTSPSAAIATAGAATCLVAPIIHLARR
ncbi:MFS transporter [Actinoplanes sp. G11-F43]|uniref:MFS transporter n=1 Tax=Actinoplanes sp. G11-F43 TaxID=3424130 RepID=UPI003D350CA3